MADERRTEAAAIATYCHIPEQDMFDLDQRLAFTNV